MRTITLGGLLACTSYVDGNKLLIGSEVDEAIWFSTPNIGWDQLNNCRSVTNSGQLADRCISPDRTVISRFLLTPTPAP